MSNFYEQELRRMFSDTDIISKPVFVGDTMLGIIDDKLRAKIRIGSTSVVHGEKNAIELSVINRTEGLVDKQLFKFADIIGRKQKGDDSFVPLIRESGGEPYWNVLLSISDKAKIGDAVLSYIELYQENEVSLTNMFK